MKKTAGVLIHKEQRGVLMLLLVNNGRHWSIPKGAIETSEKARQAACRELLEETGVIAPKNLTRIASVRKGKQELLYCYAGKAPDTRPRASREIVNARFIEWRAALRLIQRYQRPAIESLMEALKLGTPTEHFKRCS